MEIGNSNQETKNNAYGQVHPERKRIECGTYFSKNNTLMNAKEPRAEVSCKCQFQCKEISQMQKLNIINEFYALKDKVKQNSYVMGLLVICSVKRRRHGLYVNPENSRRQTTIFFELPNGKGDIVRVCKNTFMKVFGITKRRIETLVKLKKSGYVVYIDRRGLRKKKTEQPASDENVQEGMNAAVASSHYVDLGLAAQYVTVEMGQHDKESIEEGIVSNATPSIPERSHALRQELGRCNFLRGCQVKSACVYRDEDLEVILLQLKQQKLMLELEKLSEEREQIAVEKRNIALRNNILALHRKLSECKSICSPSSLSRTSSKCSTSTCAEVTRSVANEALNTIVECVATSPQNAVNLERTSKDRLDKVESSCEWHLDTLLPQRSVVSSFISENVQRESMSCIQSPSTAAVQPAARNLCFEGAVSTNRRTALVVEASGHTVTSNKVLIPKSSEQINITGGYRVLSKQMISQLTVHKDLNKESPTNQMALDALRVMSEAHDPVYRNIELIMMQDPGWTKKRKLSH